MSNKRRSNNDSTIVTIRNFVFGVEDSLVSTVGLLSGIAAGGVTGRTIFLTGSVLIFVEAFSMAVGSLLSEQTVEEYQKRSEVSLRLPIVASFIMFFSYFIAGFLPLLPYLLLPQGLAFWTSIALSLGALFLLGVISGKVFHGRIMRRGFEMLLMGGMAIFVGTMVGFFVQNLEF